MTIVSTGILCAAIGLIISGCSPTPPPAAPAKKDDKAKLAQASTNDVVVIETKSEFDFDVKTTKDPFFPKSKRRIAKVAIGKPTAEAPRMAELKLRGVIGSPGNYYAMINDKTFKEGEKNTVSVGANEHMVLKVNKITPRTVNVSVDGEAAPRDLSLDVAQEAKK